MSDLSWLKPYRTMDASGSPDSAGQVGWNWLSDVAQQERASDAVLLEIVTSPIDADGKSGVLYRSTKPIAAYFVVRDPMNFAVLYRWHVLGDRHAPTVTDDPLSRLGAALVSESWHEPAKLNSQLLARLGHACLAASAVDRNAHPPT